MGKQTTSNKQTSQSFHLVYFLFLFLFSVIAHSFA